MIQTSILVASVTWFDMFAHLILNLNKEQSRVTSAKNIKLFVSTNAATARSLASLRSAMYETEYI